MGSSLVPMLPNIILTELEQDVVQKFIDGKTLLFYDCCVDDTLVVIKPEYLDLVHNALSSFNKNL